MNKEEEMAQFAPFLTIYLLGVATPMLIMRQILVGRDDDGVHFMNFLLAGVAILIVLMLWGWARG